MPIVTQRYYLSFKEKVEVLINRKHVFAKWFLKFFPNSTLWTFVGHAVLQGQKGCEQEKGNELTSCFPNPCNRKCLSLLL